MRLAQSPRGTLFLGVRFDDLDEAHAIGRVRELARGPSFQYVVTPNVDHIVRLHSEPRSSILWTSYADASLTLCDSRILQRLALLCGTRLSVVPGSDLTARLVNAHLDEFRTIAVIGSESNFVERLRARYPGCTWRHYQPPMGVRDNAVAQEEIIRFVLESDADVVLFAIGSPQSELLCAEIRRRTTARGVGLCIGASLEFLSGQKRRAPKWMQRAGLEWLFRLLSEPRRLWRRYLVTGPGIFALWWRWRLNQDFRHEEYGSSVADES